MAHTTVVKLTAPFTDQKPGTSGLRKKVPVFTQPHYLESFVQATFNALKATPGGVPKRLVVGGDGRYYCKEAAQIIVKMAAANGVVTVLVGQNAILSTPAASAIVRKNDGSDPDAGADGAFILSASHNPGGPNGDFGIKYNANNGGPAPESLTNAIFAETTKLAEYAIAADVPDVDLATVHVAPAAATRPEFTVRVIDSVATYVALLKDVFDFAALKALVARPDFSMRFDAMHGVSGPYARRVLVEELGASADSVMNAVPLPDFGGGHPDPNLTYAHDLVERMGLHSDGTAIEGATAEAAFGAACDGDADRNMILGAKFFVSPSDSLAVLAAECGTSIPFFQRQGGLKAVARSMPTSAAVDRVAAKRGLPLFEVPTGWKFFGNLMDSKDVFGGKDYNPLLCGEESFGTSSNHVREKDGLWAVLAWLSVLAAKNAAAADKSKLVGVEDVVRAHWAEFGRLVYTRYDYEEVASDGANQMIAHLVALQAAVNDPAAAGHADAKALLTAGGTKPLATADSFTYTDPVDASVSANQGLRFIFEDGARFVFRLSGTGSAGATIRLYIEFAGEATAGRAEVATQVLHALTFSKLQEFTGRDKPTVIT